jgi:hypothetical protein
MIEFTDEEVKQLEDKIQYISHGASLSIKMPDGSLFNSKWEMAIENDGMTSQEKMIAFLRLQVYNRINYDMTKDYRKFFKLAYDVKNNMLKTNN